MYRFSTAFLCCLLACMTASAQSAGPEPARFEPAALDPVRSQEPGLAPLSARGMAFEFTCTQAQTVEEGAAPLNPVPFDRHCTFRSMDRAEIELEQDADAPEDAHSMRIYTYTKTAADAAVVICWEGTVYDDGRTVGDTRFEIRLSFTGERGGEARFATLGHSPECYGCGVFSLHR